VERPSKGFQGDFEELKIKIKNRRVKINVLNSGGSGKCELIDCI